MNAVKTAAVLLCISGLSQAGCGRPQEKPLSAAAEACKAQIAAFRSNVGLDGGKLLRKRRKIGEQQLPLTNEEHHEEMRLSCDSRGINTADD